MIEKNLLSFTATFSMYFFLDKKVRKNQVQTMLLPSSLPTSGLPTGLA
jgi:hypothetical protein